MTLLSRADVVVVVHLAFIFFAVFGGLLALRVRWLPLLHLPSVAWGAFVELTGRECPLTPLENALRNGGGDSSYSGSFVEHYLVPIIYPEALSPGVQLFLAAGLVLVNVAIYARIIRLRRAQRCG